MNVVKDPVIFSHFRHTERSEESRNVFLHWILRHSPQNDAPHNVILNEVKGPVSSCIAISRLTGSFISLRFIQDDGFRDFTGSFGAYPSG